VGYKKPPVEHQFKPGQKRKPRRKRREDLGPQILADILSEERWTAVKGRRKRMSNLELIIRRLAEKAATGSRPCQDLLYKLIELCGPEDQGDVMTLSIDGVEFPMPRWS
jgi:hypothetical protein